MFIFTISNVGKKGATYSFNFYILLFPYGQNSAFSISIHSKLNLNKNHFSSQSFSTWRICNNLCMIGAKNTAVILKNATPLYKAKKEE